MVNKSDHDSSIAKRWIPWLQNNSTAEDIHLSLSKLESDFQGLSPAQQKLIFDLIDQMKMRNEEGKNSVSQNSKY